MGQHDFIPQGLAGRRNLLRAAAYPLIIIPTAVGVQVVLREACASSLSDTLPWCSLALAVTEALGFGLY